MIRIIFTFLTLSASFLVVAQQVTDPDYNPSLANPEYPGPDTEQLPDLFLVQPDLFLEIPL